MSVRIIEGPVAHPTNRAYQEPGSIHDDATARLLGFRGGTVAASTHLDAFPPVAISAYGERWFEDGCLSLYFRHATTDGEAVRAGLIVDDTGVAAASLVTPEGEVVAEGTASVGAHGDHSALCTRDLRHEPAELRILAGVRRGAAIAPVVTDCASRRQADRLREGLVASPIEWYHGMSPWGPCVAAPSTAMEMFTRVAAGFIAQHVTDVVALWGAMELRHHGEPVMCDRDYTVQGSVVALGQTPKTEVLWYDLEARDERGDLVATTRVLTRFAKASSALYAQP